MRAVAFVVGVLVLLCSFANADWYTAKTRGVLPNWQTGGPWLTVMVFVNGSEETGDTVCVRMLDSAGESACSGAVIPLAVEIGPGQVARVLNKPVSPVLDPGVEGVWIHAVQD